MCCMALCMLAYLSLDRRRPGERDVSVYMYACGCASCVCMYSCTHVCQVGEEHASAPNSVAPLEAEEAETRLRKSEGDIRRLAQTLESIRLGSEMKSQAREPTRHGARSPAPVSRAVGRSGGADGGQGGEGATEQALRAARQEAAAAQEKLSQLREWIVRTWPMGAAGEAGDGGDGSAAAVAAAHGVGKRGQEAIDNAAAEAGSPLRASSLR